MKRTLAALLTALTLLTFLPFTSPSAQAATVRVKVESTTSASSLRVTWGWVPGVTSWYVFRSTDLKSWYYVASTTGTSYTDAYLSAGTRYFYKLAYETRDGFFYQENWSAGVPMGTTRITSITSPASRQIRLVWSRTAGAAGYLVQMATSPYGSYRTVRIARGNLATFSGVRTGLTLYFRVFPYKRIYGTTYTGLSANYAYIRLR